MSFATFQWWPPPYYQPHHSVYKNTRHYVNINEKQNNQASIIMQDMWWKMLYWVRYWPPNWIYKTFVSGLDPLSWRVMRNTTQRFLGAPKFVKSFGLHGGVIDFVWSHGFMNCCYTCSGRLTFGLCLFILFSISDQVIHVPMISDKVTVMDNGIEWSIIHQVISWILHDLSFV